MRLHKNTAFCLNILAVSAKQFNLYCIFVIEFDDMFEFDQYLGFLAFLSILTIGFWLIIFLLTFVIPYWLFGAAKEWLMERQAAKKSLK